MDLVPLPLDQDVPRTPKRLFKTRRQARWLSAYATYGTMSEACREAKVDRQRVWEWEQTDAVFAQLRRHAEQDHKDAVVGELRRRAMDGFDEVTIESVEGKERKRRSIRRVSDALLVRYAEARVPELFDRTPVVERASVTVHQTNNLVVPIERLSEADFAALERIYGSTGPVLIEQHPQNQAEKWDLSTVQTPDDSGGSEGQA